MIQMTKIILLVSLFALTGCQSYRAVVADYSSAASDASLETAEWALCRAASSGALERKYKLFSIPDSEIAVSYNKLCW